jgi:acetyl esterase/lipase
LNNKQTASQDPLLDDNIEFNKKLNSLNIQCTLNILKGLHHGFLNFVSASKDCYMGSKFVTNIINIAIGMPNTPNN